MLVTGSASVTQHWESAVDPALRCLVHSGASWCTCWVHQVHQEMAPGPQWEAVVRMAWCHQLLVLWMPLVPATFIIGPFREEVVMVPAPNLLPRQGRDLR